MVFTVNPVRKVTFPYTTTDGQAFTVTFDFIVSEDIDYDELRSKIQDKTVIETTDEDGKKTNLDRGTYNAFLYSLRKSLVAWTDICDPDGNVLEFNDNNQKAVFEAVRIFDDLFKKIILAYIGHSEKNV